MVVKHRNKLPGRWLIHHPWGCLKDMWIRHLGTQFIGGFGSVRLLVGSNDLRDSFQLKWSYDTIHICTFCCIGSCHCADRELKLWRITLMSAQVFSYLIHFGCQKAFQLPKYYLCRSDGLFFTLLHLSQRRISLISPFQWRVSRAQVEQETSIVSSEQRTLFPMEILKSQQKCRGLVW